MSKKIVQINNLMKQYGQRRVVKDVSMTLNKGEIIGLLGPNGAGKTTTFYMITGMVRVSAGNIMLNDIDLTGMSMDKRARLGLGYLAQEPSIFTDLSVEDNLKLVLEFSNLDKPSQSEKLEELLNDFSIDHIRKSIAKHLSGGERRRTEIARALILNPDFILLDEPFAGIDPIAVDEGRWKWQSPGKYYGVPIKNFLGWFFNTTIVLLFYKLFSREHFLSEQSEFYVTYSPGLLFVVLPIIAARPCFERKLNWAGTIGIVFTIILTGIISYRLI